MKQRSRLLPLLAFIACCSLPLAAEVLGSPTWGFRVDLPEGYAYVDGNGATRFSFADSMSAATLDLLVYGPAEARSISELVNQTGGKLKATLDTLPFRYRGREAILFLFRFGSGDQARSGWGLCVALDPKPGEEASRGTLLALASGPATGEFENLHVSVLDSLCVGESDFLAPGPVSEALYPPKGRTEVPLAGLEATAFIDAGAAEAMQSVIARESAILSRYGSSPLWKEAWQRSYRLIYRDAYERMGNVAFSAERALRAWDAAAAGAAGDNTERLRREQQRLAAAALSWVQGFKDIDDSAANDLVDLATAASSGVGDCDSRALLWALVLERANIRTAIMVSMEYSHAMGLADLEGSGAHFSFADTQWLVAETMSPVALGQIAEDMSNRDKWIGILLH